MWRQEHDLSPLPVESQRGDGLALHVVEQLLDHYRQLFQRHEIVGLVLKAIFTCHVTFIRREQNHREMATDHRIASVLVAKKAVRSCSNSPAASRKVRNTVLTPSQEYSLRGHLKYPP